MKKNNKKDLKIAVVLIVIIGVFTYFYANNLFSIGLNTCPNQLPSVCGIPMPPITLSNLNENMGFSSDITQLPYVNNASAVYFAGSGMNNSVYGYQLIQVVNQPNYFYSGAGNPGGSILINGQTYKEPTFSIVFPINTSNKTDIQNALSYDINNYNNLILNTGNPKIFNQTLSGFLNINLYDAISSACDTNVTYSNGYVTGYDTCIAFNEVVPVPSNAQMYTTVSIGTEYQQAINFLKALNVSTPIITTTTVNTSTTTPTTVVTTVTPPSPPPQFNIGNLLNSILSAITGFLKTIGL